MPITQTIIIDPDKLRAFAAKHGDMKELSLNIGRNVGYISKCVSTGKMARSAFDFMLRTYGAKAEDLTPDPVPEKKPTLNTPPVQHRPGKKDETYWLDLRDMGNYVALALMYGDETVYEARAKVRGGRDAKEVNFVQAVSYAAHMLYKLAEQQELNHGEL